MPIEGTCQRSYARNAKPDRRPKASRTADSATTPMCASTADAMGSLSRADSQSSSQQLKTSPKQCGFGSLAMVTDGRLLFAKLSGGCVCLVLMIGMKPCLCWGQCWAETFDKKRLMGPKPIWKPNPAPAPAPCRVPMYPHTRITISQQRGRFKS